MTLTEVLSISDMNYDKREDLTQERLDASLPKLRKLISFFREYPDLFVDFIKGDSNFKFYFYQRIFIRAVMRHKYVYATFPRAYSKSFLSMMVLMLRAILYPGSHLAITTGGKEQAASITVAKIEEICNLIPALANEINWERGASKKSKNDAVYVFKNGSQIDILAATERSRGQRRTGLLMEECVSIDQTALNEIIIPTTNIDRRLPDGTYQRDEIVNKSQIYITTAGWKNTFAYDKLIELEIRSIIEPDLVMILGGTYETPVAEGLQSENFVDELKLAGTYNADSFDREYCSKWSGDVENAFYSAEKFDKHRQLLQPEYEYSGRSTKAAYYVLGVDVGRLKCTTEICVFKVNPQANGSAIKSLVNIYTYDAEDFEVQAINIKKLYYKYKARIVALDANGLGVGLVDFLTKTQIDPETGDMLPPFGIEGGTSEDITDQYKKVKGTDVEMDALFLIKATLPINTEAYSYAKVQMLNGKVKFLIDETQAKTKMMTTKVGQNMSIEARNDALKPFQYTTVLREQMLNLVEKREGINIILDRSNSKIPKDKFSAFIYGLYYIKLEEDKKRKKKKRNISDYMFFSKPGANPNY